MPRIDPSEEMNEVLGVASVFTERVQRYCVVSVESVVPLNELSGLSVFGSAGTVWLVYLTVTLSVEAENTR